MLARLVVCLSIVGVLGCESDFESDPGTPIDIGLFAGDVRFQARHYDDGVFILVDKPTVYDFEGTRCTVSGADLREGARTDLFRVDDGDFVRVPFDEPLVADDALLFPARGHGVAFATTRADAVFVLHDGTRATVITKATAWNGEPPTRTIADAAADLDAGRVLFVDERGQLIATTATASRVVAMVGNARIASLDATEIALARMASGPSRLVIERRALETGAVLATTETPVPVGTFAAFETTANGTPRDFRVVFATANRRDRITVVRVRDDVATMETNTLPGRSVQANFGRVDLVVSYDGGFPVHHLNGAGELTLVADGDDVPERVCDGHTTVFPCGGQSCAHQWAPTLDGEGGVALARYVAWYPGSHHLALDHYSRRAPVEQREGGDARVRVLAFGHEGGGESGVRVTTFHQSSDQPKDVVDAPFGELTEYVLVPHGGGLDNEGTHVNFSHSGDNFVRHEVVLPDSTERVTIVYWEERSGEAHHVVWDEAAPSSPTATRISSIAWVGRPQDLNGNAWYMKTDACAPYFDATRVAGAIAEHPELAMGATREYTFHFESRPMCESMPVAPTRTFTSADVGKSFLAVLDGITARGNVRFIESGAE